MTRWRVSTLVAVTVVATVASGCNKKKQAPPERRPPPELSGLAAVPVSTRVLIGADPARLADSEIVARAFGDMLARDPDLGVRTQRLAEACALDVRTQLASVHVALTTDAPEPLLVVTGRLAEADLAKCVQTTVGAGGGQVTAHQVEGRTLYKVDDAGRVVTFGFGRADTVVVSASEKLVIEALGPGPKVLDDAEMKGLIDRADARAPLWAVGKVDGSLGQRLTRLTGGAVTTPPKAFLAALDPSAGLRVSLGAVMATVDEAKALESHVNPTLALVAIAAQARGLGQLAAKIAASRDDDVVRFGVDLTSDEVKEVLSRIDSRGPSQQDASPGLAPGDAGAAETPPDGGARGD
ncbi:MAG: hypothetical protein H6709_17060 [Kofleriaceae bacterium]|nr:hypothetical protein [Myxococcales bacterium]MCB9565037.1 hypothetical protein [Kofleriaceae bacterium]MCB9573792.1 hypothetical protein [Kofleriaceae bacterium]